MIQICHWTDVEKAAASRQRGHLFISRTAASARRLLPLGDMDVCPHAPSDPRGFATLLTEPLIALNAGHWRHVWLLDGEVCAQEAEKWLYRLPDAKIHILPVSQEMRDLAAAIDAGDPAYRTLYKALRTGVYRSLAQLAETTGLTLAQVRAGLHAFRQLGLMELTETPLRYTLLSAAKCALSDSPVLGALRRLANGKD